MIQKHFLFNPENSKKSFNVYNPKDTIHIKYTTLQDVQNTINKLEKLYKNIHTSVYGKQVYVRLKVLKNKKPKQYALAHYFFRKKDKVGNVNQIHPQTYR